jgi:hypothetical protein
MYVKDANVLRCKCNCGERCPPTIVAPAAQCFECFVQLTPNTITTTYNGTKIYTLNGVVLASSSNIYCCRNVCLGIRDDNGCEDFVNYTIEEQVLANAILTKDLCVQARKCYYRYNDNRRSGTLYRSNDFKWNTNWWASCGRYRSVYTVSVATGTYVHHYR